MAIKKIIGIVFLEIAIVGVIILGLIVVVFFKCENDDLINAQRLKALQADGVLSCRFIDRLTPLRRENYDLAGSRVFGNTPTDVDREFNLNGVDPDSALAAFAQCAQANGWSMTYPGFQKYFPGGWKATLGISVHDQTIHIRLETDAF